MIRSVSSVLGLVVLASLAAPAHAQFVNGDLYVSGYGSTIYHVDPTTWTVTTFADAGDGLNGVSASVLSPAGMLLCSNYGSAQVLQFDSGGNGSVLYDGSTGLIGPFGENGLAFAANGDLYVSDFTGQRIRRYPAGGGASTVFADSSQGIVSPDGLAFAANGDLFVADRGTNNILEIDPSGNATVFDTLPNQPFSLVIRANGDLYVATMQTQSLYRYPGGDVSQRTLLATFSSNQANPAIQLSLDQTKLYFTSFSTGNLIEVDADTGAQNQVIAAGGLPGAIAITVIGNQHSAHWSNYGSGLAGTNGVPAFTSQEDPVLGTTNTLDLDNSYGQPTTGLMVVGFQQASLHTGLGGDLLLIPSLLVPITFSFSPDSFPWSVPNDPTLDNFELDLQAVEADPGAVKGYSFTQGLSLVLGY